MKHLNIKREDKSPEIIFNEKELRIIGRSNMVNSLAFYKPIINSIRESLEIDKDKSIQINLHLEYIESTSNFCLLDLLRLFVQYKQNSNNDIIIHWYYDFDDDNMYDLGKEYSQRIGLPFIYISLNTPKNAQKRNIKF